MRHDIQKVSKIAGWPVVGIVPDVNEKFRLGGLLSQTTVTIITQAGRARQAQANCLTSLARQLLNH